MAQYINKDDLVAEIRSRLLPVVVPHGTDYDDWDRGANNERVNILSFINTLEAKEVNLEEEINHWQGCEAFPEGVNITPLPKAMDIVERTAKHFFELGINTRKGE